MQVLPDDMYDAIPALVGNIPLRAKYVAGYVDSVHYTWPAALWARFTGLKVRISTTGTDDGHVGDCETGDLTPPQVVDWVSRRRGAGVNAIVYCNFSTWPSVQDAFSAAGTHQPPYWIARYDAVRSLPTLNGITAVAKQYLSTSQFDLSCVAQEFIDAVTGGAPMAAQNAWLESDSDPNEPPGSMGHLAKNTNQLVQDLRNPTSMLNVKLNAIASAVNADVALDRSQQAALSGLADAVAKGQSGGLTPEQLTAAVRAAFPGWDITVAPKTS